MNTDGILGRDKESGQVLVMVAVFLVGLLALSALVLDGGDIYLQRRRMQNAADAGAMAGARILALEGTTADAIAAAQEYTVQRNGADSCDITIDQSVITVVAHKSTEMTFARVVGVNQVTVDARASATFKPVAETGDMAPIAIKDFAFEYSETYTIWDDDVEDPPDPTTGNISGNNRGWLNLDCVYPEECGDAGSSLLTEWMQYGYPGTVETETWIRGSSGVKTRPVAITQTRIGDVLKIAVYVDIQDKHPGKAYYHVKKFAAFRVTRVHATGNPKGIEGKFEKWVTPGRPGDGDDGGLRTIVLTQ